MASTHVMRGGRRRYVLDAAIAELQQVDAREQVLAAAEQDRRDSEVQLVDEAGAQVLADRRRPATQAHVFPIGSVDRPLERLVDAAGNEMGGTLPGVGRREDRSRFRHNGSWRRASASLSRDSLACEPLIYK